MPEVQNTQLAPDPTKSGTGQGALTKDQQRILADIWYRLNEDQSWEKYKQTVWIYHNVLTPAEQKVWQDQLDKEEAEDPQGYWNKVARAESLPGDDLYGRGGRSHAEGGGYNFPQVGPTKVDANGHIITDQLPPSKSGNYNPADGDGWDLPENNLPPGWSGNSGAAIGDDGQGHQASNKTTYSPDLQKIIAKLTPLVAPNVASVGRGARAI